MKRSLANRPSFAPTILWIVYSLFIVYATLIPFNTHARIDDALSRLGNISLVPFIDQDGSRASMPDIAQNVLFFVPFGALGLLAIRRRNAGHVVVVTVLGVLLSLGVEALQLFTVDRSTSTTDLATNSIGAFVGAATSYLFLRSFSAVLNTPAIRAYRDDKHFFLVLIALAVIVVGTFQPFSFTLDVGFVASKVESLINDPLRFNPVFRDEPVVFLRFCLSALVCAFWFRKIGIRHFASAAIAASCATGVLLEGCQIFVTARMPTAQDVVVVALGSTAGGLLAILTPWQLPPRTWTIPIIMATWFTAGVEACSPFRLAAERAEFGWLPFSAQYESMSFSVLKRLLEALLIYFPMGFIFRFVYSDRNGVLISVTAAIAFSVEYAQGWIEGRHPGITDVLTGIAGAAAGAWACARWTAAFESSPDVERVAPARNRPRRLT